jgi:DNA-binding protein H-NS
MKQKLEALSIDELAALRSRIVATLDKKIAARRRDIEGQLVKMSHRVSTKISPEMALSGDYSTIYGDFTPTLLSGSHKSARRGFKVAPKFRHPDDPTLTWAGRGLMPIWLREATKKRGVKLDDFRVTV